MPPSDAVRLNVYLPRETYDALRVLQKLAGKRSLAETIRSALRLYAVVHRGAAEGKELYLVDGATRDRLIFE